MLDLIENYESCRFQLQKRICELNQLLRQMPLPTRERENLTARRDMLLRESAEILEDMIEIKKHCRKEVYVCDETCSRVHTRI